MSTVCVCVCPLPLSVCFNHRTCVAFDRGIAVSSQLQYGSHPALLSPPMHPLCAIACRK